MYFITHKVCEYFFYIKNASKYMDSLGEKEKKIPSFQEFNDKLKDLKEGAFVYYATKTWKVKVPQERLWKVSKIFDRWEGLIWTEYELWWVLWENGGGIDCSHFVAYSLWLPTWQKENTRSLDNKYKKNEVKIDDAKPWDLLMWPWHYDSDVGRDIGHVEIVVWKTLDGKIVTLWASGLSRKWDKYSSDGKKLSKHNCVGFSIREKEDGMRILRA